MSKHNRQREYDYLFKIVLIGDSGVGKSCILNRFCDDKFQEEYQTTIGVDFKFKTITVDNKKIKLQIWDTAGQERFRTVTSAYYKNSDSIVMIYDITSQPSFDNLQSYWMEEIKKYVDIAVVELVILGNKSDLLDKQQVVTEKVQAYADDNKLDFYELSAKSNEYVEKAFVSLARKLKQNREKQISQLREEKSKKKQQQKTAQLDSDPPQEDVEPVENSSVNLKPEQKPKIINLCCQS